MPSGQQEVVTRRLGGQAQSWALVAVGSFLVFASLDRSAGSR